MSSTIFFSWQSDTPSRTTRGVLQRALDIAIATLAEDADLEPADRDLAPDRDTQGVPGSPRIVDTILAKIDAAAVFVADVTFVGQRRDGRPTPNPNVLIEYGYALRSLTHERVITVMNTAYGAPTETALPFDMRHLRWPITFDLAEDAPPAQVAEVRQALAKILARALKDILSVAGPSTRAPEPPAFAARPSGASPGRFRAAGEPLAYTEPVMGLGPPTAVHLPDGPVAWLRLMPLHDPGRSWSLVDLKAVGGGHFRLRPFSASKGLVSNGRLRAADGFGTYGVSPADPLAPVLLTSFAFTTGEVWGIDAFLLPAIRDYLHYDANELGLALDNYRDFLVALGLQPPFRWICGLEGTHGRHLPSGDLGPLSRYTCIADTIDAEGRLEVGQSGREAIRPFIDRVFDLCGAPRPASES